MISRVTSMSSNNTKRALLITFFVVAMCMPPYIFFSNRGGLSVLSGLSFNQTLKTIFPMLGMYAFTFVTMQVIIANNLRWLKKIWHKILTFHRAEGIFALMFALLHPGFILLGFGINNYLHFNYLSNSSLKPWLIPSYTALFILICTVTTAFLAWRGMNIPFWRKLHRLNYLVFALVWIHSSFIGTDTPTIFARGLWLLYLMLVVVSVAARYKLLDHLKREPA